MKSLMDNCFEPSSAAKPRVYLKHGLRWRLLSGLGVEKLGCHAIRNVAHQGPLHNLGETPHIDTAIFAELAHCYNK